MTQKPRVLYVCHNHPLVRPGGAEAYAYELFRALRAGDDFDAVFLAKGGPPFSKTDRPHVGSYFAPVGGREGEYFFFTDGYPYDAFFGTTTGKELYTKHFRSFLTAMRPDVVHFQHTLFLGFDLVREARNTLPDAPILYTLHEFLPICNHYGQMIRTFDGTPCLDASPRRCHECYPEIGPERFFLRKRFVQAQLGLVDLFVAPSRFLLERYVDWGIARERIVYEEYGRAGLAAPPEPTPRPRRNRIGYFGQLTPFKGAHVLLEAMQLLRADGVDAHCFVHGANLDMQGRDYRERFEALLGATSDVVTMVGRYEHDQLPQLMERIDWVVVPSIWWENSPLVIQEAFAHGKPVICSDIGGMAEKVTHGVDGIHFRAGDATALATALREAIAVPGVWERLRSGIRPVYAMEEHVARLTDVYGTLLARRGSRKAEGWTTAAAG